MIRQTYRNISLLLDCDKLTNTFTMTTTHLNFVKVSQYTSDF